PGNVLPGQYINMGKKFYDNYAKYWPDPNNWFDKSIAPNSNPFLSVTAPYNWTLDQYSGRMDVNLGSKIPMFGRFTQHHFVDIRQQVRSIHAGNNDGQYTFNNTYFRQCDDACANGQYSAGGIGLSWAGFMIGLPSGITISGNDSAIVSNPYYAWFVQDTWRV